MPSILRPHTLAASALAVALVLTGCGDAPDGEVDPSSGGDLAPAQRTAVQDSSPGAAAGAEAPVALPGLFAIMMGLQGDAERISRGLWAGDFDAIAAGARSIADHPTVPPAELARVREALGEDIVAFRSLDTRVHDLAVRLEQEAANGAMEAILTTDAELRAGCVACHSQFRDRLREGLGG